MRQLLDRKQLTSPVHPVGLEPHIAWVKEQLTRPQLVVLHGMAGVGKTAIANSVYNCLQPDYSVFCYVEVTSEVDQLQSLKDNLKGMIAELCNLEPDQVPTHSTQQLTKQLEHISLKSTALIVLDDVRSSDQFDNLLSESTLAAFQSFARIIITTRNPYHVNGQVCLPAAVRHIGLLDHTDSRHLFCLTAFQHAAPSAETILRSVDSMEAIDALLVACDGLPRTIIAVAQHVKEHGAKRRGDWRYAKRLLSRASELDGSNNGRIFKGLTLSLEGLHRDTRTHFMDAACLLEGEPEKAATVAWGSSADGRLQRLKWQSMLDIKDGVLTMQRQWRDLGRFCVHQSGPEAFKDHREKYWWDRDEEDAGEDDEQVCSYTLTMAEEMLLCLVTNSSALQNI